MKLILDCFYYYQILFSIQRAFMRLVDYFYEFIMMTANIVNYNESKKVYHNIH